MFKKLIYFVALTLVFGGCSSCGNKGVDADQEFAIPDSAMAEEIVFDPSVVQEMAENVASPVEIAALIKSLKVPFSKDILAPTKNIDGLNTNFKRAIGFGVYGADLGYINMYSQNSMVLDYITGIKTLADGLKVGQFFDFTTLKRLATNKENIDSLMHISTQNFNKIDAHLKETNRSSLSCVIVAGVWIEGLYLSCQVASIIDSDKMNESIGEQKIAFSTLYKMLSLYKKDPNISELVEDMKELKSIYDEVTISYEIGEPDMVEENGIITFKQNDKSNVNITDDQLKRIRAAIIKVRNKQIGG
jgi:hypothetical protein